MADSRLRHIDAMRGFTILLVVYSHVLAYLVDHTYEGLNFYFLKFRMPLFFFISGFFIYSPNYTFDKLRQRSRNRLLRQLWPTVVLSLVFVFTLYRGSFARFIYGDTKAGYWFTLVAVEMFAVLAPLLCAMNYARLSRRWQTAILLCIIVATRTLLEPAMLQGPTARLLSLSMLWKYMPFIILGIAFRINEDALAKVITSTYTFVAVLATFFMAWHVIHQPTLLFDVEGICGVCIIYYVFNKLYGIKRIEQSRGSRMVEHVGQNTLEIYLLHYFVILGISRLCPEGMFHALRHMPGECVIVLAMAAIITAITLGIARLLRQARLYRIIFAK